MKKTLLLLLMMGMTSMLVKSQVTVWNTTFEAPEYTVGDTLNVMDPNYPSWSGIPYIITDSVTAYEGTQCVMSTIDQQAVLSRYDSLIAGHEYTFSVARNAIVPDGQAWKANHSIGIMSNLAVSDTADFMATNGVDTTRFLWTNQQVVRIYNQIDNPDPKVDGDYVKFIYAFDPAKPGQNGTNYKGGITEVWQLDTYTFTVYEGLERISMDSYRWDGSHILFDNITLKDNSAIPISGITMSEALLELSPEETATLTATVAPEDATYPLVEWSSSNEDVATVDSDGIVTAIADGIATIKAMDVYNSETAGETQVIVTTVGIGTNSLKNLSIYPNPASDLIHLDGIPQGEYDVSVFSITGSRVFSKAICGPTKLSVNALTNGLYFVEVKGEQGNQVIKIQKF